MKKRKAAGGTGGRKRQASPARKKRATIDEGTRAEMTFELARRCVEGSENVGDVARELGISRTFAHTLLQAARRSGGIRTVIVLDRPPNDELRERVLERLRPHGIETVRIIATPADDHGLDSPSYRAAMCRSLGSDAARFVSQILSAKVSSSRERKTDAPTAHIIVDDGWISTEFARTFDPPKGLNLLFSPIAVGGRRGLIFVPDAASALQHLAWRLLFSGQRDRRVVGVICPECPPGLARELNEVIGWSFAKKRAPHAQQGSPDEEAKMKELAQRYWELMVLFGPEAARPDIVLSSVGLPEYYERYGFHGSAISPYWEMLAHSEQYGGLPSALSLDQLREYPDNRHRAKVRECFPDVAADIGRHGIRASGEEPANALARDSISIRLDMLREWAKSSGFVSALMAGGSQFRVPFLSAARTKCFNSAIMDTALAVQLVPREERPDAYRLVPDLH